MFCKEHVFQKSTRTILTCFFLLKNVDWTEKDVSFEIDLYTEAFLSVFLSFICRYLWFFPFSLTCRIERDRRSEVVAPDVPLFGPQLQSASTATEYQRRVCLALSKSGWKGLFAWVCRHATINHLSRYDKSPQHRGPRCPLLNSDRLLTMLDDRSHFLFNPIYFSTSRFKSRRNYYSLLYCSRYRCQNTNSNRQMKRDKFSLVFCIQTKQTFFFKFHFVFSFCDFQVFGRLKKHEKWKFIFWKTCWVMLVKKVVFEPSNLSVPRAHCEHFILVCTIPSTLFFLCAVQRYA